jgi:hypothetical protein
MAAAGEREAIEAVIRDCLEGMIYNQKMKLERAMHPLCMVTGHYLGSYDFMPRDGFIASLSAEKPQSEGTPITSAIVSLDITGDAAMAKVTDECFG